MHQVKGGGQHDAAGNSSGHPRSHGAHAAHKEEGQRAQASRSRHAERHDYDDGQRDGLVATPGSGGCSMCCGHLPVLLPSCAMPLLLLLLLL